MEMHSSLNSQQYQEYWCTSVLAAAAVAIFSVYVITASPSIAGGDSGELVAEGCSLGTAHPPGYPLFTLLIYTLKKFLPIPSDVANTVSVAYRANISSGVFSSAAAYFIGKIILLFPGRPHDLSGALFGTYIIAKSVLYIFTITPQRI